MLVIGTLDAEYYNKVDEEYAVIFDIEEDEIINPHETGVGVGVAKLADYFVINLDEADNDALEGLFFLVEDLYANVKYDVANVAKTSDGYAVTVNVYPLDVIGLVGSSSLVDAWDQYESDKATVGAVEAQARYIGNVTTQIEIVMEYMDYLDPVQVTVPVREGADGSVWISDTAPLDDIEDAVIKYDYDDAS